MAKQNPKSDKDGKREKRPRKIVKLDPIQEESHQESTNEELAEEVVSPVAEEKTEEVIETLQNNGNNGNNGNESGGNEITAEQTKNQPEKVHYNFDNIVFAL